MPAIDFLLAQSDDEIASTFDVMRQLRPHLQRDPYVSMLRELRARATQDPRVLHGRKLEHYRASLDTLRACTDGLPLVDQLEFELWALDVLPPSQPDNDRFTDR